MSDDVEKNKKKKPMSDDARRCIIRFMSTTKRLLDFPNHPALFELSKSIPLYIPNLELFPTSFEMGSMRFTYGSILLHPDCSPLPKIIIDTNKIGGFPFDANKHGAEMRNIPETAGDIKIFGTYRTPFEGFRAQYNEPFDVFVKCTGIYEDRRGTAQAVKNGKIHEMIKKKLEEFLMGGPPPVVHRLLIGPESGILRLPIGLQLHVQQLDAPGNSLEILQNIIPIIHPDSFPLKILLVKVSNSKDPIFKNDVFQAASVLRLGLPQSPQKFASALISLKNPHIQLFENELHFKEVFEIVENWKNNPRPVGCTFAICVKKCLQTMIAIKRLLDGYEGVIERRCTDGFPTAVFVPVNDEVELAVYSAKALPIDKCAMNQFPHQMTMEVVPWGTAKPLDQENA